MVTSLSYQFLNLINCDEGSGRIYFKSLNLFFIISQSPSFTFFFTYCVTQLKLYTFDKLSSTIFCCLSVSQALVTPNQISIFSNIYRHKSPILTLYQIIRVTHSILGLVLTSFQGRQEISWRKERQRRRRGEAQDEHSCQVFHFHNERAHSQDG